MSLEIHTYRYTGRLYHRRRSVKNNCRYYRDEKHVGENPWQVGNSQKETINLFPLNFEQRKVEFLPFFSFFHLVFSRHFLGNDKNDFDQNNSRRPAKK